MLSIVSVMLLMTGLAKATPIIGVENLPLDADSVITFNDAGLANFAAVSNQFSGEGASFDGLSYSTGFSARANTDGGLLFAFSQGPASTSFTIDFTSTVSRAFFALGSNQGLGTFSAFLGGNLVELFKADISNTASPLSDSTRQPNVFGFEGLIFDRLVFSEIGSTGYSLDNLSFDIAVTQVPIAGTLYLVLLSFCGLFASRKLKKN